MLRNHKGLKITVCTAGANSGQKIHRDNNNKKPNCQTARALCTQQHQRGGQITEITPPAWPLDALLPSPHGSNQLTSPWGAGKGICFLFFHPHCCSRDPNQALPEFFVWSFLLIKEAKILVSNNCVRRAQAYINSWDSRKPQFSELN